MGSVLRTRGSLAPAAERRGPSARSGAALTRPGLFLWPDTHAQISHHIFRRWSFSSPRGSRRHGALFIYIVREPNSEPRWTNCFLTRRGRTSLAGGKHTKTHAKRLSSCRPPVFDFPSVLFFFSFLRFISCCQTRNPGLCPCSEDERKLDFWSRLWGCFTGFISLWRKKRDPGAERCAKKKKAEVCLLSSLLSSSSPYLSIYQSVYLSSSIYLSICFHVLGPCDFAKMHHQQRMAALGTDKELSDLLDFSAVRKRILFFLLIWI